MAYSALEENHGHKFYEQNALLENTHFDEVIIFRPKEETIPPKDPITMMLRHHTGTEILSWLGTKLTMKDSSLHALKTYGECQLVRSQIAYVSVRDSGVVYIDKDSHIDRLTSNGIVYMDSIDVVKDPIRLETGGKICLLVDKDPAISMRKYIKKMQDYFESRIDLSGHRGLIMKYTEDTANAKYQFNSIVNTNRIWLFVKRFDTHSTVKSPS